MTNPTDLYPDYPAMLTEAILWPHKQPRKRGKWVTSVFLSDVEGMIELPACALLKFDVEERKL